MLTDRQLKLIDLLKSKEGYVKQEKIAREIEDYGTYEGDYHNTRARIMMTDDIRAINSSMDFDGIILSDRNGIKLADRLDCERKLKAEFISVLKALIRVKKKFKKFNLDGQAYITDALGQDYKDVFNMEV